MLEVEHSNELKLKTVIAIILPVFLKNYMLFLKQQDFLSQLLLARSRQAFVHEFSFHKAHPPLKKQWKVMTKY